MVRRWLLSAVVAAVLVGAAVLAAHAIRGDTEHARETTTPSASTTTQPASSTTTVATTTAPSSTAATTTSGPPGACGRDTGPIRVAVEAAIAGAATNADISSCRLAASDPSWAAVQLTAKPGAQFDARTVILHGGAGSWAVVASGGANAGCGQAPQQVIADLGQFCAGTGGGAR